MVPATMLATTAYLRVSIDYCTPQSNTAAAAYTMVAVWLLHVRQSGNGQQHVQQSHVSAWHVQHKVTEACCAVVYVTRSHGGCGSMCDECVEVPACLLT